jgi:hypothetical protein
MPFVNLSYFAFEINVARHQFHRNVARSGRDNVLPCQQAKEKRPAVRQSFPNRYVTPKRTPCAWYAPEA